MHCHQALDHKAGNLLLDGSRRAVGQPSDHAFSTLQLVALTTTALFFFLLTKTEGPGYLLYGWRPRHLQETKNGNATIVWRNDIFVVFVKNAKGLFLNPSFLFSCYQFPYFRR